MEPGKSEFKIPANTLSKEDNMATNDIVARVAAIAQYNLNKLNNPLTKVVPISPEAKSDPTITENEAKVKLKDAYQKFVNSALERNITNQDVLSAQVRDYAQLIVTRNNTKSLDDSFYSNDVAKNAEAVKEEEKKREADATRAAEEVCSKFNIREIDPTTAGALLVSLQEIANQYGYGNWEEVAKKGGLNESEIQKIKDACVDQFSIFSYFTVAA